MHANLRIYASTATVQLPRLQLPLVMVDVVRAGSLLMDGLPAAAPAAAGPSVELANRTSSAAAGIARPPKRRAHAGGGSPSAAAGERGTKRRRGGVASRVRAGRNGSVIAGKGAAGAAPEPQQAVARSTDVLIQADGCGAPPVDAIFWRNLDALHFPGITALQLGALKRVYRGSLSASLASTIPAPAPADRLAATDALGAAGALPTVLELPGSALGTCIIAADTDNRFASQAQDTAQAPPLMQPHSDAPRVRPAARAPRDVEHAAQWPRSLLLHSGVISSRAVDENVACSSRGPPRTSEQRRRSTPTPGAIARGRQNASLATLHVTAADAHGMQRKRGRPKKVHVLPAPSPVVVASSTVERAPRLQLPLQDADDTNADAGAYRRTVVGSALVVPVDLVRLLAAPSSVPSVTTSSDVAGAAAPLSSLLEGTTANVSAPRVVTTGIAGSGVTGAVAVSDPPGSHIFTSLAQCNADGNAQSTLSGASPTTITVCDGVLKPANAVVFNEQLGDTLPHNATPGAATDAAALTEVEPAPIGGSTATEMAGAASPKARPIGTAGPSGSGAAVELQHAAKPSPTRSALRGIELQHGGSPLRAGAGVPGALKLRVRELLGLGSWWIGEASTGVDDYAADDRDLEFMERSLRQSEAALASLSAVNAMRVGTLIEQAEVEFGLQSLYAQLGRPLLPMDASITVLRKAGLDKLLDGLGLGTRAATVATSPTTGDAAATSTSTSKYPDAMTDPRPIHVQRADTARLPARFAVDADGVPLPPSTAPASAPALAEERLQNALWAVSGPRCDLEFDKLLAADRTAMATWRWAGTTTAAATAAATTSTDAATAGRSNGSGRAKRVKVEGSNDTSTSLAVAQAPLSPAARAVPAPALQPAASASPSTVAAAVTAARPATGDDALIVRELASHIATPRGPRRRPLWPHPTPPRGPHDGLDFPPPSAADARRALTRGWSQTSTPGGGLPRVVPYTATLAPLGVDSYLWASPECGGVGGPHPMTASLAAAAAAARESADELLIVRSVLNAVVEAVVITAFDVADDAAMQCAMPASLVHPPAPSAPRAVGDAATTASIVPAVAGPTATSTAAPAITSGSTPGRVTGRRRGRPRGRPRGRQSSLLMRARSPSTDAATTDETATVATERRGGADAAASTTAPAGLPGKGDRDADDGDDSEDSSSDAEARVARLGNALRRVPQHPYPAAPLLAAGLLRHDFNLAADRVGAPASTSPVGPCVAGANQQPVIPMHSTPGIRDRSAARAELLRAATAASDAALISAPWGAEFTVERASDALHHVRTIATVALGWPPSRRPAGDSALVQAAGPPCQLATSSAQASGGDPASAVAESGSAEALLPQHPHVPNAVIEDDFVAFATAVPLGTLVEARDPDEDWGAALVVAEACDAGTLRRYVRVRYPGYSSANDDWISVADNRIMPLGANLSLRCVSSTA